MAIVVCPSCGRFNISDKLAAEGFRCEMCKELISRPSPLSGSPQGEPPLTADPGRLTSATTDGRPVGQPAVAAAAPDAIDVSLVAGNEDSWKSFAGRVVAATSTSLMFIGGLLVFGGATNRLRFGVAGVVAGSVMGLIGNILYRLGKRLLALRADQAERHDPRPPVLLLRRFADDNISFGVRKPDSPFVPYSSMEQLTFEQMLAEEAAAAGPVVAIGKPGEGLPLLGAARTYVGDDEWRVRVEEYLLRSGLVVMVMGRINGENGLAWELRNVLTFVPPERVVFVVPPVEEVEARSRWTDFHDRSGGRLPAYQGGELAAGFCADGACRVVRANGGDRTRLGDEYRAAISSFAQVAKRPMASRAAALDNAPLPVAEGLTLRRRPTRRFSLSSWWTMLFLFVVFQVGFQFSMMFGLANGGLPQVGWRDYGISVSLILACVAGGGLMLSFAAALDRRVKNLRPTNPLLGVLCSVMVAAWLLAAFLAVRLVYVPFVTAIPSAGQSRDAEPSEHDRGPSGEGDPDAGRTLDGTPDQDAFEVDAETWRSGWITIPEEVIRHLKLNWDERVTVYIEVATHIESVEPYERRFSMPHDMRAGRKINVMQFADRLDGIGRIRIVVSRR
jgi:hypothetical protein